MHGVQTMHAELSGHDEARQSFTEGGDGVGSARREFAHNRKAFNQFPQFSEVGEYDL